jgi:hypothetical protein
MADESPKPYRFEKVRELRTTDKLIFCDPANIHDWSSRDEWGVEVYTFWRDLRIRRAQVYAVMEGDTDRALVVTNGSAPPPPELLEDELRGSFYIVSYIGVDSGQVGVYTGVMSLKWGAVERSTYMGDGIFPIVWWPRDGEIFAVAALTDIRYFEWRLKKR